MVLPKSQHDRGHRQIGGQLFKAVLFWTTDQEMSNGIVTE